MKKSCVDVVSQLQKFKDSKTIVTHYVDPTSHAPRKFVEEDFAEEDWWKCCLRITDVGTTFSVRPVPSDCGCDTDSAEGFLSAHPSRMMLSSGKTASVKKSDENFLARSLWGSRNGPKIVKEIDVVSVIQLEVELLTGYVQIVCSMLFCVWTYLQRLNFWDLFEVNNISNFKVRGQSHIYFYILIEHSPRLKAHFVAIIFHI